MPKWDYKCSHCEKYYEMTFRNLADRDWWAGKVVCDTCHAPLERLPAAPGFVVTGFNAKNGYSK